MKTVFQILILSSISIFANGQTKAESDTLVSTYEIKWKLELEKEIKLRNINQDSKVYHFRYWNDGQVVDIWKKSDSKITGSITNYTREYIEDNWRKKKKPKTYYNKVKINIEIAKEALNFIHQSKINDLPTDRLIEGWEQGCDGISYSIELFSNGKYSMKSYWTPKAQDSLKEALLVQNFITTFEEMLNLKYLYNKFFDTLPVGCYNTGSIIVTCKED
jgi:hypothetical protein